MRYLKEAIVVTTNNLYTTPEFNAITQRIAQEKTVFVYNVTKNMKFPREHLEKSVAMQIFFYHAKFDIKDLTSALRKMSDLKYYRPRLKTLLINVYNDKPLLFTKSMMKHCWKIAKYLDFSMIIVNLKEKLTLPVIEYYNPFNDTWYYNYVDDNVTIFPDKQRNVHGFPLKEVITNGVHVNSHGDYTLDTYKYDRLHTSLLLTALKKLNYTVSITKVLYETSSLINQEEAKAVLLKGLDMIIELERQDVTPIFNARGTRSTKLVQNLFDKFFPHVNVYDYCDRVVAVVPIIYEKTSLNFSHPLIAFAFSIVLLAALNMLVYVHEGRWNSLWSTSEFCLRNFVRVVLFAGMSLLSVRYLVYLYCDMISSISTNEVDSLDTFQQIYDSKLTVYETHAVDFNGADFDDPYVQMVLKETSFRYPDKLTSKDRDYDCLKELMEFKNIVCFMREEIAKLLMLRNRDLLSSKSMRFAKHVELCTYKFFRSEIGAPWVEKLQMVVNNMIEAGIHKFDERSTSVLRYFTYNTDETVAFDFRLMFLPLIVCYCISIILFLYEIGSYYRKEFNQTIINVK